MTRRSSFAIAAALTSVALTATAAVSLTGDHNGTYASSGATEPTAQPSAVAVTSAVITDPEVRSASEKADAVLTDADHVTREGDLTAKERERLLSAAQGLRGMLERARAETGPDLEVRPTAASRSNDRASLAERAAPTGITETAKAAPASSAEPTDPTNLAGSTSGAAPISEAAKQLAVLAAPLTASSGDPATNSSGAQKAGTMVGGAHGGTERSAATATPSADGIEKAAASLEQLIIKAGGEAVVSVTAGPTPEEIAAAERAAEERRAEEAAAHAREEAAARAAEAKEMAEAAKSYGNGQIPSSVLCGLSWAPDEQLRCDAAAGFEDLNGDFRAAFGRDLAVTDGYRSYPEQVTVAATRGGLAAVPGTSNHGWGQAVDLSGGIESFGSAEHSWMVANAGKHGWNLPFWAQAGGSKPEAWHWEYGTSY